MVVVVILAGGGGERLWPVSRVDFPKQFISLDEKKSLLQSTYELASQLTERQKIFISTWPGISSLINEQISSPQLIVEPMRKDSAAGIGYACSYLLDKGLDEPTIFMGVDYVIKELAKFKDCLELAYTLANEGKIATIGIVPRSPETRFGYIHPGEEILKIGDTIAFKVESFKEKPDKKTAEKYIKNGFLWNSGMFISKPSTLYQNIKTFMPQLYLALERIRKASFSHSIGLKEFDKLEKISIDYGVMEKTNDLVVVGGNFYWDDIGTWDSLTRIYELDENNNVIIGHFEGYDIKKSVIFANRPVIAYGLSNVVIVNTDDCVFVCDKDRAGEIKKILQLLKNREDLQHLLKKFN